MAVHVVTADRKNEGTDISTLCRQLRVALKPDIVMVLRYIPYNDNKYTLSLWRLRRNYIPVSGELSVCSSILMLRSGTPMDG